MEKVLIPGLDRFQEWDIYKINPGYIIIIISNKMLKHTHTHTLSNGDLSERHRYQLKELPMVKGRLT